ncbi:3727_t:CDS:2, partial [Funneliformis geosporum]
LLSESSCEYEIFRKAFAGLSIQRIRRVRRIDSIIITNPDLVIENFMKFSQIVSNINWNGPIIVITGSTKLRQKLVYAEELNYIARSTLPHSEMTVKVIENIHPRINHIIKSEAIATQICCIALKVPIAKVLPMMVAIIPTKGNKGAEQIAHLIRQVIEMTYKANLNILSFRADDARSDIIGNVALEVIRILSNPKNKNNQLYEEENLNDDEEEDDKIIQQLLSVEKFPDIQYIIQHQPISITFYSFQQFFTNNVLNVTTLLQIRQDHNAFSCNLRTNFNDSHQTTINRDNNQISGN